MTWKAASTIGDADTAPGRADQFSLETAFGSVKPSARPGDFEELARVAKDERAAEHFARFERSSRRRSRGGGA